MKKHPDSFSDCQKTSLEFASADAKKDQSVFRRDMCVAENTSRLANVQIVLLPWTICALRRGAILLSEKALPFSTG